MNQNMFTSFFSRYDNRNEKKGYLFREIFLDLLPRHFKETNFTTGSRPNTKNFHGLKNAQN